MTYKGYIGHVEFDDEQHILTGYVVNTRDVITFQGESVSEVEKEFHASVDEYLAWCVEDGIVPGKPYSGKFVVRVAPDLHQKAAIEAKRRGISLNRFIEQSVRDEINFANVKR